MIEKNRERIKYVDYAKAVAIFLVILGHINNYNELCKVWIYSFHMPLFFLLSGITSKYVQPREVFPRFVINCKKLLVPYFIFGLIFAGYSEKKMLYLIYGSYETIKKSGSLSSLWFLPTLLFAKIIVDFTLAILEKYRMLKFRIIVALIYWILGAVLPHLSIGYPFGFNVGLVAAGFILFGNVLMSILGLLKDAKTLVVLPFFCFWGVISIFSSNINTSETTKYILMGNAEYGNYILFIFSSIGGSLCVILFCILLEKLNFSKIDMILTLIGMNSMSLMILQKPVISIIQSGMYCLPISGTVLNVVALLLIGSVVTGICLSATKIINICCGQILGN